MESKPPVDPLPRTPMAPVSQEVRKDVLGVRAVKTTNLGLDTPASVEPLPETDSENNVSLRFLPGVLTKPDEAKTAASQTSTEEGAMTPKTPTTPKLCSFIIKKKESKVVKAETADEKSTKMALLSLKDKPGDISTEAFLAGLQSSQTNQETSPMAAFAPSLGMASMTDVPENTGKSEAAEKDMAQQVVTQLVVEEEASAALLATQEATSTSLKAISDSKLATPGITSTNQEANPRVTSITQEAITVPELAPSGATSTDQEANLSTTSTIQETILVTKLATSANQEANPRATSTIQLAGLEATQETLATSAFQLTTPGTSTANQEPAPGATSDTNLAAQQESSSNQLETLEATKEASATKLATPGVTLVTKLITETTKESLSTQFIALEEKQGATTSIQLVTTEATPGVKSATNLSIPDVTPNLTSATHESTPGATSAPSSAALDATPATPPTSEFNAIDDIQKITTISFSGKNEAPKQSRLRLLGPKTYNTGHCPPAPTFPPYPLAGIIPNPYPPQSTPVPFIPLPPFGYLPGQPPPPMVFPPNETQMQLHGPPWVPPVPLPPQACFPQAVPEATPVSSYGSSKSDAWEKKAYKKDDYERHRHKRHHERDRRQSRSRSRHRSHSRSRHRHKSKHSQEEKKERHHSSHYRDRSRSRDRRDSRDGHS